MTFSSFFISKLLNKTYMYLLALIKLRVPPFEEVNQSYAVENSSVTWSRRLVLDLRPVLRVWFEENYCTWIWYCQSKFRENMNPTGEFALLEWDLNKTTGYNIKKVSKYSDIWSLNTRNDCKANRNETLGKKYTK